MKKIFALIIVLCVFCPVVTGAENVPSSEGWVNDYANVISPEYREKLTALISELEAKTSAEIAVVTVGSIAPQDEISYARMIFDKWKIGKKGKDNGILMLLAIKERRWRIESGYGAEGILPDGKCGEIGRAYMVPLFKEGKYSEGLYQGVVAVSRVIADDAHVTLDSLKGVQEPIVPTSGAEVNTSFLYLFVPIFFFVWNLPWPVYIGLPVTLLFALIFSGISPLLGVLAIGSYIASMIFRFTVWRKLPKLKRSNFFGPQTYGGRMTTGGWGAVGGGWGGGGGGWSGGGGFGGGGGGGGGSGGGF